MKITIDKAIELMKSDDISDVHDYSIKDMVKARDMIINVVLKYQKIEQIVSDDCYLSDYNKIKDIKGVVDGKID